MDKHPHPNGGSCSTPSLCAAREALSKLRAFATERGDAELHAIVSDLVAAILPADEQQPTTTQPGHDRRGNGWPTYVARTARS